MYFLLSNVHVSWPSAFRNRILSLWSPHMEAINLCNELHERIAHNRARKTYIFLCTCRIIKWSMTKYMYFFYTHAELSNRAIIIHVFFLYICRIIKYIKNKYMFFSTRMQNYQIEQEQIHVVFLHTCRLIKSSILV